METANQFIPFLGTSLVLFIFLWCMHWLLIARHDDLGNERKFPRQLIMMGLTIVSIIIIALVLPVNESSRNQLIGLIGLLVSGLFAFSSTTVVANLMAGMLIRVTNPFRTGDFIRVGDHFGRVAEKGLFDTEIQSETSELIAIPNTYLITHPVTTVRSSGTIISASLSLGYDEHHSKIETILLSAAKNTGLEDPYVHIIELGDYYITYRVSGLLSEIKGMITARSRLYCSVLDALHDSDVEIVSPTFMNQRRLPDNYRVLPPKQVNKNVTESTAEDIAFQKAEEAEQVELREMEILDAIKKMEAELKEASAEHKDEITMKIRQHTEHLKEIQKKDGSDGKS